MARKVLIADDSPLMRRVLHNLFDEREEWETVGEAANGTEAVQKALELKPDLILMDVRMPKLNGVEAASVLKHTLPGSYIIVFTMYEESIGSRLRETAGVDLVVSKTEGLKGLIEGIRLLMGSVGFN